MQAAVPVTLAEIPGTVDSERLVLMMENGSDGTTLLLCQQSWAEGIGWFTQSRVEIAPAQLPLLRQSLGGKSAAPVRSAPLAASRPSHLRIVG